METSTRQVMCCRRYNEGTAIFRAVEDTSYSDWQQCQPIGFTTVSAADDALRTLAPDKICTIIPVRILSEPPFTLSK